MRAWLQRCTWPCDCDGPCFSKESLASVKLRWPRCWPTGLVADSSASSATRASMLPRRSTNGTTPGSCFICEPPKLRGRAQGADSEALEDELYDERFLVRRPLLQAISPSDGPPPVLLVDEVDRADDEFEAFLLRGALRLLHNGARAGHVCRGRAPNSHRHIEPHSRRTRRPQTTLYLSLGGPPRS